MNRFSLSLQGLAASLVLSLVQHSMAGFDAPYPPSSFISDLKWLPGVVKMKGYANGDNWPIAWMHDDSQLTAFCDGKGFSKEDPDLSLGFAWVYGDPPEFSAENIRSDADTPTGWGAKGIKASDMIAVDDVLYMFVRNYRPSDSDDFTNSRLACSTNSGVSWTWANWHFADTFGCPAFVQFGKNYQGARDEYVYIASQANDSAYGYSPDIVMARAMKDAIMKRSQYSFFGGMAENGRPIWSKDIAERKPIFMDPKGTQRIAITYNAGLGRYILTSSHLTGKKATHTAALGVFEAPEPWGPWSTVYYERCGYCIRGWTAICILSVRKKLCWKLSGSAEIPTLVERMGNTISKWRGILKAFGLCLIAAVSFSANVQSESRRISVKDSSEFRRAVTELLPGTTILLEPGTYSGGIYLGNISGKDGLPIVIEGTDPNNPPLFEGGKQAIHLANCSYMILKNIKVRGFPTNGINIDDGGSFDTPANNIVLENVTILDTGPKGNHDALKMSGVDHFVVRKCRFEGWGGSGIDMVGCHHGIVEDCIFTGREGFSQSNGAQLKGGTEDVLVQCCFFKNAGQRSVNLGGSTGLQFFRPRVNDYEAKNIT
ncbi:MAG: DUF4185 domain-containing protein, partial [Planctomycetota bacterium]